MSDFRGETMYFIVTDRFFDGDPSNNLGKDKADFDPERKDFGRYWGGDLAGVLAKLEYLEALGVSSLWLTPLFDQVDVLVDAGGTLMAPYHGYWAKDFRRVDEHLVNDPRETRLFERDDTIFDELLRAMHKRGMKFILDIVCNHSSPQFGGQRGELYDDGRLIACFDKNAGGWYRKLGGVENWSDLHQVQTRDLAGLADFNEESHEYRTYIKSAMKQWVDKGVDGFRVDTVKHMPLWFWQEFTGDLHVHAPDLFVFGEWFMGGCYDAASVEFASKSGMSILDFGWYNGVTSALARRSPRGMRELEEVVSKDHLFRDTSTLVTFIDNHDVPRFLSVSNDRPRHRLALLLTLVSRGIPCIYYGNEQYLHDDTNGGGDPFNRPMMTSFEHGELCADVAKLAKLRRESPAVQKGGMRTKFVSEDAWVVSRAYQGSTALICANRGDLPFEAVVTGVELVDGRYEDVLGGPAIDVKDGAALVRVGPAGIAVFSQIARAPVGRVLLDLQVHGVTTQPGEDVFLCGDAPELGCWDVAKAITLEYVNQSTWAATVPFEVSAGREIHYKYMIRKDGKFVRETGRGHRRLAPKSGAHIFRDTWRS